MTNQQRDDARNPVQAMMASDRFAQVVAERGQQVEVLAGHAQLHLGLQRGTDAARRAHVLVAHLDVEL